jgi:hypothetical protein
MDRQVLNAFAKKSGRQFPQFDDRDFSGDLTFASRALPITS